MLLKAMARARGRKRRQRGVLTWTRSKKGECRATSSNRFDIQRTMNVPTPGVHRATRELNSHFESENFSNPVPTCACTHPCTQRKKNPTAAHAAARTSTPRRHPDEAAAAECDPVVGASDIGYFSAKAPQR